MPKAANFRKGNSQGGRPKGSLSGRSKALGILDTMLGTEGNQKLLRKSLQAHFKLDPVKFFRQIVMPLLPKESLIKMQSSDAKAGIRLFVSSAPEPPSAKKKKARKKKGS